ncbi:PST-A protein [Plasmodium cynomolgi strain B]|uniref:PST-A protein n=1 Tax=Plasmodium cynomolgi (strain B) TaxID=1120755 RepID=K6ULJ5_PLACD|nr:PST-A protein [Plasmodium cynomolgi strain B]GAB67773.1 PST-A protein [Plasmodium cynomolgi strain B]
MIKGNNAEGEPELLQGISGEGGENKASHSPNELRLPHEVTRPKSHSARAAQPSRNSAASDKLKTSLSEDKSDKKYTKILYDDGNPEITFFVNKENLKIAKYAWRVENPKAYVFALHGITSHLRNEYLNYMGRPSWVDEKQQKGEMASCVIGGEYDFMQGNNYNCWDSSVSVNKSECKDDRGKVAHGEGGNNFVNLPEEGASPAGEEAEAGVRGRCGADEKVNTGEEENGGAHGGTNADDGSAVGCSFNKILQTNWTKDMKIINETNNMMYDYCQPGEGNSSGVSSSCDSSDYGEKKNLEKKLTMFLSCSSCITNINEGSNHLNSKLNFGTGESGSHPLYDNDGGGECARESTGRDGDCAKRMKLNSDSSEGSSEETSSEDSSEETSSDEDIIDDENVLLPNKSDTHVNYDSNVYYCSMCGICNYCNCGVRTLSYKNSWIEKFNQNGFSFFGIDNQSHGLSEGFKNYRCYVEDFESFIADTLQALEIFIEEWKEKDELKPIIIMGLSMGGCIALKTMEAIFRLNKEWKAYVKSLVLVSPMISLGKQKNKISNRLLISATKFLKYFFPLLPVNVKESNARYPWIKHDSEIDPHQYCGPLRIRIAAECVSAADSCLTYKNLKHIEESDIDIMVIQSKNDCLVDPIGAIDFLRKMMRLHSRRERRKNASMLDAERIRMASSAFSQEISEKKSDSLGPTDSTFIGSACNPGEEDPSGEPSSRALHRESSAHIRAATQVMGYVTTHGKKTTPPKDETVASKYSSTSFTTNSNHLPSERQALLHSERKEDPHPMLVKSSLSIESTSRILRNDSYFSIGSSEDDVKGEKGIWTPFDHGYYKSFNLKKLKNVGGVVGEDPPGQEEYKNLIVYILKYGCHTLPGEPHSRETVTLLVDWLNRICS